MTNVICLKCLKCSHDSTFASTELNIRHWVIKTESKKDMKAINRRLNKFPNFFSFFTCSETAPQNPIDRRGT